MKFFRVKKAFTLIELIVVILIVGLTYSLIFSSNSFNFKKEEKVELSNLKQFLLENFSFEKELSFICIEDNFTCYVKIDNDLLKGFEIKNFFNTKPNIYEYNRDKKEIEFKDLRVDNFDYKVIFQLKVDSDYKTNQFVLDAVDNNVYVFNPIFTKPKIYKSLDEVFKTFTQNIIEVQNAF